MSKVTTFSRKFPKTHPRSGHNTNFIQQIWAGLLPSQIISLGLESEKDSFEKYKFKIKSHTIRGGNRYKKGEYFSPRVWSGVPYNSKQIVIAQDLLITYVWGITIEFTKYNMNVLLNTEEEHKWFMLPLKDVADNDGLSIDDFKDWFNPKQTSGTFKGQIICWNENIKY